MRNVWCFSILMTATLLLSSCMSPDVSASLDRSVMPLSDSESKDVSLANESVEVERGETQFESECLNCHSDKERLIETAKEEEVVEAESSGVG